MPDTHDTVPALADAYWDALMRRNPEWATILGDHRFDDRLADLSDDARAAWVATLRDLQARLARLDAGALADADRLTRDVLAVSLRDDLEGEAHLWHTWKVDQLSGPQVDF